MLSFQLNTTTGILEVTETLMSFTENRSRYWYYDIVNWRVSSHGKKHDKPDRELVPAAIAYVREHYLPMVLALPAPARAETP